MAEIKAQARNRGFKAFHFSFSGGEPTLHPDFLKIIKAYAEDAENCSYQSLHMTSNCSPGIKWFEKYLQAANGVNQLNLSASFHSEFADREEFLEKMLFLKERGVAIGINIVMAPKKFDFLVETGSYFRKASNLIVSLKPQSDENALDIIPDYTPEQLAIMSTELSPEAGITGEMKEFNPQTQVEVLREDNAKIFLDHSERLNSFGFNKFQGWDCSAGYRSIIIREPCGSIKRGHGCKEAFLGNIETGFQLFDRVEPCKTAVCIAAPDNKIPKRRPGSQVSLWPGEMI